METLDVKVEDVSSIKKQLSFEVASEKVDTALDKAYRKVVKSAKVPGFRKGKVPRGIIEKQYGPQMQKEAIDELIRESYFKALVDNKIAAVSGPEITEADPLEKGTPFNFTAEVEVKPDVEARDYTGLELKKEQLELSEDYVEGQLEEMRSGQAQMEVTSRKMAREGDHVVIDFEGFIDGEPFEGGKAEDHELELGSGSFLPGFEEQIERMKRGEEKNVNVTFPEDYGAENLAGKEATFQVTLKEIKEKTLPKLDKEFAEGFGMESVEELKNKLQENYEQQEKQRVDSDLRERLMEALVEANPIQVPESMVSSQLDYMFENTSQRLKSQGMSIEMLGMDKERFAAMYHDTAAKQVKGSLLLEAVARQEDLTLDESEIDGKLEVIAEQANAPLDAVKQHYSSAENRNALKSHLLEEKAIEFLLDKAEVKEVPKTELQEEPVEEEKE
ncbi:MAG: trigger factor [Desulfuromonadales bacterium]